MMILKQRRTKDRSLVLLCDSRKENSKRVVNKWSEKLYNVHIQLSRQDKEEKTENEKQIYGCDAVKVQSSVC